MQAFTSGAWALHRSSRAAIASVGALTSVAWGTSFQRWATKKGGGSSANGRTSQPKMLGVKKYGGEKVLAGNIIIRQRGTKFWPGENVGLGRDHTIWSLIAGHVKFKWSGLYKQYTVMVVPHLKYGQICEHKAVEARSQKKLLVAQGYIQQARFAYKNAGDEGKERLPVASELYEKLKAEIDAQ